MPQDKTHILKETAPADVGGGVFSSIKKKVGERFSFLKSTESARHRNVSCQLSNRGAFPSHAWDFDEKRLGDVQGVFRLVAENFDWPNNYFYPGDPLSLIFEEGFNEYGLEEFILDVRDNYGISIDKNALIEIHQNGGTAKELVGLIFSAN